MYHPRDILFKLTAAKLYLSFVYMEYSLLRMMASVYCLILGLFYGDGCFSQAEMQPQTSFGSKMKNCKDDHGKFRGA